MKVSALDFSYLDDDGRAYDAVPAGFSGCAGNDDLPITGERPAGSKGTGWISFDGRAHGTIVFSTQGQRYAWKVG